ncbi:MAG: Gfo/Idh/MocA family oxidoreductase [Armatimonadota bacterium]|jgi:predicted dehydrogenase
MKKPEDVLRVGGVGTGRIFQWAHMRVFPHLLSKARLVGFFDKAPARAEEARDKYAGMLEEYAADNPEAAAAVKANLAELRCHDSLGTLLDQVDIIDVCTTPRAKMPAVMAALEAGVHSMVEKPMARTWIEADRAARAFAAAPDVYCQLNDDNVFEPKYRILHDLLQEGAVGRVQTMSLIRGCRTDATSILKSQADPIENGGGCLMDYGSHGLAGAWYALGTHLTPTRVEAVRITVRFPDRTLEGDPFRLQVDDDAHVKVLFEDPDTGAWATIFLEATWSGGEIGLDEEKGGGQAAGYLRIEGDEGFIDASAKDRIAIRRWDGDETAVPVEERPPESSSFSDEIETCIDAVRAGTPPEIDVHFGAEIIAIIGAAYLSAIRGRAVTIDEFKEFSREYVARHGDNERAEEAIIADLLAPYRGEA